MPWSLPPGLAGRGNVDVGREDETGVHREACRGPARRLLEEVETPSTPNTLANLLAWEKMQVQMVVPPAPC